MSGPRIVFYAARNCPHCAAARAAIEASGEPYDERDPLSSGEVLRELLASAASAVVPTIVISGRALVGFDADRLEQMLREPPLERGPLDDYTEEELSGTGEDLSLIP
jgi:glutaredoxin